jgi:hypothetical protein
LGKSVSADTSQATKPTNGFGVQQAIKAEITDTATNGNSANKFKAKKFDRTIDKMVMKAKTAIVRVFALFHEGLTSIFRRSV